MPTIAYFNGILIILRPTSKEHLPPHVHAIYGGDEATFRIPDGKHLKGNFPLNKIAEVKKFIQFFGDELLKMWNEEVYHKIEPTK